MRGLFTELLSGSRFQRVRYGSAYVLFLMIVVGGSIPHAREELGHFAPGLILHSLAYAVVTFLLWSGASGPRQRVAVRVWLTVAAMGAIDEVVQSFFPYRTAAVSDWLVDCGASAVALIVLQFAQTRWAFLRAGGKQVAITPSTVRQRELQ